MDIHRCRFVPYPPSTINSLAFSKSYISKDEETAPPRLAIGRANGDIEIWNPLKGSWLQETIIRGGQDRSIDGLVWTQDPNEEVRGKKLIGKSRLFSIGYTTTVTEWDLEKGRPLRQASGNHGEIWCIAAQPSAESTASGANGISAGQWPGQSLIAGCVDGALVLYSTKDDDLQLQKTLVQPSSKKAKIISVVFQDRNIVVAGCTDSMIRIFDIRNGSLLRSMSTGSGPKGGPKEIIIWSVKVLKDGTIVSGDSTGELKIWDGKTYTLRQRIKSHKQDVLSLATSHDGSAIFSGGMDRRTVIYKPVSKGKSRWAEVAHRRFHTHDVKTMASFESAGVSVVVSGGPDASPTVVPLGQFGFENQRTLPFLPQETSLRSAPKQRLMMSWWEREVHIWRVSKTTVPNSEDSEEPVAKGRKLVAKIFIKGEANINSATLSPDGSLLAVSTSSDIKVFQLRPRKPEEGEGLKVSKVSIPSSFSAGARLLQFSPNGKWLCIIRSDGQIVLARLSTISTSSTINFYPILSKLKRLDRHLEKLVLLGGLGTYDRTITQVAFSSNSALLAVSDIAGYIDTFVLEGHEDLLQPVPTSDSDAASSSESSESDSDSENEKEAKPKLIFGQHWTRNPSASSLPKLPCTPVVLSFRPATQKEGLTNGVVPRSTRKRPNPVSYEIPEGEDRLLVVTATSDVYEFEVLKGGLSAWSRRNPTSTFPEEFRKTLEQVRGCIWDVSSGEKERIWLYSIGWLWMFDLSRDLPPSTGDATESSRKRKRKHGAGGAIPDEQLGTGISRKVQRHVHEEMYEEQTLVNDDAMDIDEEAGEEPTALERLRRGSTANVDLEETGSAHHWHTFKYRPILGIVEIGEGDGQGPEVAIVERPIWEADLPPRYYGDQEWPDQEVSL